MKKVNSRVTNATKLVAAIIETLDQRDIDSKVEPKDGVTVLKTSLKGRAFRIDIVVYPKEANVRISWARTRMFRQCKPHKYNVSTISKFAHSIVKEAEEMRDITANDYN